MFDYCICILLSSVVVVELLFVYLKSNLCEIILDSRAVQYDDHHYLY